MYTSRMLSHFHEPRNVGDVEPCDGSTELSLDWVTVRMSVRISGGLVEVARFRSTTCVVAVACCSALTEMATGLPVNEARAITADDVAVVVGGIPARRMGRCKLAVEVLRRALADAAAAS
ncbi:MAG: iron-sulfur cluster assembly scaffold protein [Actinomycetota bacterium]|nr:iron-sulfur cluster assembly scaffold protein [Actinomycetota bacterium]MDP3630201.1 iron-sulfur cluster assembly scaffold protein [Actinomycetota bacterium]